MTQHTNRFLGSGWMTALARIGACAAISVAALPLLAAQVDIPGPAGSVAFGTTVTVLPNGNFVVTDPLAGVGAVHLYSSSGVLISTLTGSTSGDEVGSGGIVVLGNGNFVVVSPLWDSGNIMNAGAVTWVDGTVGLSGTVAPTNSLVGSQTNDLVGSAGPDGASGVVALGNGHYVVASSNWSSISTSGVGAVTWANGSVGRSGEVSPFNSLTGSTAGDSVGFNGVTALANGHYVVRSSLWTNVAAEDAGAVTWANGTAGIVGEVSSGNSLVGTSLNDLVGSAPIAVLGNGNYVVVSPSWSSAENFDAGAVTWANGATGRVGQVSESNSLVGSNVSDRIGFPGVTVLTNGNYVVRSTEWDSDVASNVGAVTWASGASGLAGVVGPGNSLIGSTNEDRIGDTVFVTNRALPGVAALANGNYVVASASWDNGAATNVGAVTWADGSAGRTGMVSPLNSLIGSTPFDAVGSAGARPLANGHYVVLSPSWTNGATTGAGAATWASGNAPTAGTVSTANSLVGTRPGDSIGSNGRAALTTGHYVVLSPFWDSASATDVGAATWVNGNAPASGVVDSTNSLIGTTSGDIVGSSQAAVLANGNYVVSSPNWDNGGVSDVGAITLADGDTGLFGAVSSGNSLVGTSAGDTIGNDGSNTVGTIALSDGSYVVLSEVWNNGAIVDAGAVTLARGDVGATGMIDSSNSVLGTVAGGGANLVLDYDAPRGQLVVGRPDSNIVTLFDIGGGEVIFDDGFE